MSEQKHLTEGQKKLFKEIYNEVLNGKDRLFDEIEENCKRYAERCLYWEIQLATFKNCAKFFLPIFTGITLIIGMILYCIWPQYFPYLLEERITKLEQKLKIMEDKAEEKKNE